MEISDGLMPLAREYALDFAYRQLGEVMWYQVGENEVLADDSAEGVRTVTVRVVLTLFEIGGEQYNRAFLLTVTEVAGQWRVERVYMPH